MIKCARALFLDCTLDSREEENDEKADKDCYPNRNRHYNLTRNETSN